MGVQQEQRVLVLGGGFGGVYAARTLSRSRAVKTAVTLIDRNNFMVFYPLLVEAGAGGIEPRHAVASVRAMAPGVDFRMAEVTAIDAKASCVRVRLSHTDVEQTLPYDHLVVALGAVTRRPPVPGLAEHAFEMKTLADAVVLRDRAVQMMEQASALEGPGERARRLTFVVVGGNYTGVEFTGEFYGFLRKLAAHYPRIDRHEIQVVLIEREDRILPTLDDKLAGYAARQLQRCGVRLILGDSIARLEGDKAVLASGEAIPSKTCVWAAGIQPNPLIAASGLPTDTNGYIQCEPDLRVAGMDTVWAIGDAANNPDPEGNPYPATAQHAIPMGKAVAHNIERVIRGERPRPFAYQSKGALAGLGCHMGVAKVWGLPVTGFPAWWLHRTVYLMKMPGLGRRARIAFDWTADLIFGRDVVELHLAQGLTRPGQGPPGEIERPGRSPFRRSRYPFKTTALL